MAYRIELAQSGKHVRVTVQEAMTRELATKIGLEATEVGRKAGVARFLYDLRSAPNTETVLSNYQFAHEEMPQLDLERNARVALLVEPGDRSHDFVATALRNAGFNTHVFDDESNAIDWLEAVVRPPSERS